MGDPLCCEGLSAAEARGAWRGGVQTFGSPAQLG